jgi:hypothetical protein
MVTLEGGLEIRCSRHLGGMICIEIQLSLV